MRSRATTIPSTPQTCRERLDSSSDDPATGSGGPQACPDPALDFFEPASCPDDSAPLLPAAGCYEACEGPDDPCAVGTCTEIQYEPCPCPPDAEACCGACAATGWLCVEDTPSTVCDEVVGTSFRSIDDLDCSGPMESGQCPWWVYLNEDYTFVWLYLDTGEEGTYTCEGDVLTLLSGPTVDVAYDTETNILTWDGDDYLPVEA